MPLLDPGAAVSHWRVDALAGRGGGAEVFAVTDTRDGSKVRGRVCVRVTLSIEGRREGAKGRPPPPSPSQFSMPSNSKSAPPPAASPTRPASWQKWRPCPACCA